MLLPLLTLGILSPFISAKTIENETTGHMRQLIRQVTRNIEFYVKKMEGIILTLTEDQNIKTFFEAGNNNEQFTGKRAEAVNNLLFTVSEANPEIAGILLVNENTRKTKSKR